MSIPTTEHETIQLHRSSQADADSDNSSPGPKNSAFSDARDSVELHTLLRTSIENGNPLSQQSGEAVSQGESDEDEEDGKDIQSRSGISDLSESYTQQEERAIVRKFDRRLVLFMALLYLLSFLDRSSQTPPLNTQALLSFFISQYSLLSCYAPLTDMNYLSRHWKCAHCWSRKWLVPTAWPICLAPDSVLHHLYIFRMDDTPISSHSTTHLHHPLRLVMGLDRLAAVNINLLQHPPHLPCPAWHCRSRLRTRRTILSLLFLQTFRIGLPSRSLHLRCTTSNQLCQHFGLAHCKAITAWTP